MKRVLFWILPVMTVVLAIRIAKILILDIGRLTSFGYGYLIGQLILFSILLIASLTIGLRMYRQNRKTGANRQ